MNARRELAIEVRVSGRIRSIIERSTEAGSLFVKPGDRYVVVGRDEFDGSFFPAGASSDLTEAVAIRDKKREEEFGRTHDEDDNDGMTVRFDIFSRDGMLIQTPDVPGSDILQ